MPASRSTSPIGWRSSSASRPRALLADRRSTLLLALPAIGGTLALLIVTRRGAYLSPDALAYVGTANNLVGGNGYQAPPGSPHLANFPPLFPLVLAGVAAFGPDPLTVARFLNPLLFGATLLLVGLLVRRITGSLPLAVAAQVLVVAGIDFLAYHSSALSEPLFLLLSLLALAAVLASLDRHRPGLVAVAALLAGAACLTRYLGLVVVAAGAGGLVLLGDRRRWKSAVAFTAISLAPLAGWLVWLAGAEGRATNRRAVLHLPDGEYVLGGLKTASAWILPPDLPWPVRLVAAAVVALALVRMARRSPGVGERGTRLLALFALAYLAALVADRLLFDVTGRLDDRFLLPLHVVAVIVALRVLSAVDVSRSRGVRTVLSAIVGLQLASATVWLYDAATDPGVRPGGFAAPAWARSQVLDELRALPPGAAVFSNQPDAVYFHTGRHAQDVPAKRLLLTGEVNADYGVQLETMHDALGRGGVLAYFTATPARRVFLPTPAELATRLRLEPVVRDKVGALYKPVPPAASPPRP